MKFEKYYFSLDNNSDKEKQDAFIGYTPKIIFEEFEILKDREYIPISELTEYLKNNPKHELDKAHLRFWLNEDQIEEIENILNIKIPNLPSWVQEGSEEWNTIYHTDETQI